jgi:hypothetical protein
MRYKLIPVLLIFVIFTSFRERKQLIQDPHRLADIQRMLTVQKEMTSRSLLPIWEIFKQPLSGQEREAMEFLYAYMPLSDLADYKPEFFLNNVRMSLTAREEMPWGKKIPEEEFLHFVLPVRVYNGNLDSFRIVMYPELKERIKGMSMKEAALEINHWCHERVTYRSTDLRTSSPLNTVKKSFGRCGEESVLTVSAMRAVGIPSRQVYTPRWAHFDDNHSWVEVWIDGKWQYMGGCEPEADLNMGWFSEPVKRAMLVNSRTYGHYTGNTEVTAEQDIFSELNLTSEYAKVKKVSVFVRNPDGSPVDSAKVTFKVFNFGEFFTIATRFTNKMGIASLSCGLGDLMVWASKGQNFDLKKLSVAQKDTMVMVLNQKPQAQKSLSFDLVPPPAVKIKNEITEMAHNANDRRIERDDSIRGDYMKKTFKEADWIADFAEKNKLPLDSVLVYIKLSYGNWDQVTSYLEKNASKYRSTVLLLADQLSNKDFSDITESIITDHLEEVNRSGVRELVPSDELFGKYVLSPRIGQEKPSPWRSFLNQAFGEKMAEATRKDITFLTNWIRDNIAIIDRTNKNYRAPLTPIGVYNLRVADPVSRDIFFVAACRTFGIPADLNHDYYKDGKWMIAPLDSEETSQPDKGILQLINRNNPLVPEYSLHYTIAKFNNDSYKTLDFQDERELLKSFRPIELETGDYVLVSGNRLQNGTVLSQVNFFRIEKGKLTTLPLELRKPAAKLQASGRIDLSRLRFTKLNDGKTTNLSSLSPGKGSVLVLLDPSVEPSRHILNDLKPYLEFFDHWGGPFIFAVPSDKIKTVNVFNNYTLPRKTEICIDSDGNLAKAISSVYHEDLKDKLPLLLYCDEKGNVFMFSSGYFIGAGEQLLKAIIDSH